MDLLFLLGNHYSLKLIFFINIKKSLFLLSIILLIDIVSACGKDSSYSAGQAINEQK